MKETILKELENGGLSIGRLISGSKTLYRKRYPKNFVCFNANIFVEDLGKVWWGDIDITKEHKKLLEIAEKLNLDLYILYEMDGRFGNENRNDFKNTSVWNTKDGLGEIVSRYYTPKTLKLRKEFLW